MQQSGRLFILTLDIPHLSFTMLLGSISCLSDPLLPFTCHKARSILTLLCSTMWKTYLSKYPNGQLVEFFLQGLTKGFHIGFDYASAITVKSAKSNMESTHFHTEVVDEYLQTEISLGRVARPFPPVAMPDGHVSRFGVIPENHQPPR